MLGIIITFSIALIWMFIGVVNVIIMGIYDAKQGNTSFKIKDTYGSSPYDDSILGKYIATIFGPLATLIVTLFILVDWILNRVETPCGKIGTWLNVKIIQPIINYEIVSKK